MNIADRLHAYWNTIMWQFAPQISEVIVYSLIATLILLMVALRSSRNEVPEEHRQWFLIHGCLSLAICTSFTFWIGTAAWHGMHMLIEQAAQ
jgi:hypothetical protein